MNRAAVCLVLVQLALAASAQDSVKFTRAYTAGQTEKFDVNFTMVIQGGDLTVKALNTLTVKRVYSNGEVDIETALTDIKANMAGQDLSNQDQRSTRHCTADGMPIGGRSQGGFGFDYARTEALLFSRDLPVGKDVSIEWTDPKDSKSKIKGTVNVEAVKDGVAKILSTLQIWDAKTADSPTKATVTTSIDVATSRVVRVEGLVTNLPADPNVATPTQIKFTRVRVP